MGEYVLQTSVVEHERRRERSVLALEEYVLRLLVELGRSHRGGSRWTLKLARVSVVGRIVYSLLCSGRILTKRDLYYMERGLLRSQRISDEILEYLAEQLNVERNDLNVVAARRSLVIGDVRWITENGSPEEYSASSIEGAFIPPRPERLLRLEFTAKFILIVEKETIFDRLARTGFQQNHAAMLVTSRGYPNVATVAFLKAAGDATSQAGSRTGLLCMLLTDGDPHGLHIASCYARSLRMSSLRLFWIGLHPLEDLPVEKNCYMPLSSRDLALLEGLRERTLAYKEVHNAIHSFLQSQCKIEVEALMTISPDFLAESYLPSKIDAMLADVE